MTICDPATGWFEVAEIRDKSATQTAKILDQVWFCRYPRPFIGKYPLRSFKISLFV
jgi:hypothetical protein